MYRGNARAPSGLIDAIPAALFLLILRSFSRCWPNGQGHPLSPSRVSFHWQSSFVLCQISIPPVTGLQWKHATHTARWKQKVDDRTRVDPFSHIGITRAEFCYSPPSTRVKGIEMTGFPNGVSTCVSPRIDRQDEAMDISKRELKPWRKWNFPLYIAMAQ